jgi:hypothetical protein
MYRIVLVSTFRDLTILARSVARQLGITVEVHEEIGRASCRERV